jgi:hypothetical protein
VNILEGIANDGAVLEPIPFASQQHAPARDSVFHLGVPAAQSARGRGRNRNSRWRAQVRRTPLYVSGPFVGPPARAALRGVAATVNGAGLVSYNSFATTSNVAYANQASTTGSTPNAKPTGATYWI